MLAKTAFCFFRGSVPGKVFRSADGQVLVFCTRRGKIMPGLFSALLAMTGNHIAIELRDVQADFATVAAACGRWVFAHLTQPRRQA